MIESGTGAGSGEDLSASERNKADEQSAANKMSHLYSYNATTQIRTGHNVSCEQYIRVRHNMSLFQSSPNFLM